MPSAGRGGDGGGGCLLGWVVAACLNGMVVAVGLDGVVVADHGVFGGDLPRAEGLFGDDIVELVDDGLFNLIGAVLIKIR